MNRNSWPGLSRLSRLDGIPGNLFDGRQWMGCDELQARRCGACGGRSCRGELSHLKPNRSNTIESHAFFPREIIFDFLFYAPYCSVLWRCPRDRNRRGSNSAVGKLAALSLTLQHHNHNHGRRNQSYQREDPLQQSPRLCLLNTYVSQPAIPFAQSPARSIASAIDQTQSNNKTMANTSLAHSLQTSGVPSPTSVSLSRL